MLARLELVHSPWIYTALMIHVFPLARQHSEIITLFKVHQANGTLIRYGFVHRFDNSTNSTGPSRSHTTTSGHRDRFSVPRFMMSHRSYPRMQVQPRCPP